VSDEVAGLLFAGCSVVAAAAEDVAAADLEVLFGEVKPELFAVLGVVDVFNG
jgi:hypothetical protein